MDFGKDSERKGSPGRLRQGRRVYILSHGDGQWHDDGQWAVEGAGVGRTIDEVFVMVAVVGGLTSSIDFLSFSVDLAVGKVVCFCFEVW